MQAFPFIPADVAGSEYLDPNPTPGFHMYPAVYTEPPLYARRTSPPEAVNVTQ